MAVVAVSDVLGCAEGHEVGRMVDVTGGDGMSHRLVPVVTADVPFARPFMQERLVLRLQPAELAREHLAKQRVPAIAAAGRIDGNEKQVRVGYAGENARGVVSAEHGVTGGARQAVQHRCPYQKLALRGG